MTSKRKTSEVWTYFSVDQDTPVFAQCLLCDQCDQFHFQSNSFVQIQKLETRKIEKKKLQNFRYYDRIPMPVGRRSGADWRPTGALPAPYRHRDSIVVPNFQKKSMSWSGIRSGPVRSTGSRVPIRSGPVRFRKSRSGRLLTQISGRVPWNNVTIFPLISKVWALFIKFDHHYILQQ